MAKQAHVRRAAAKAAPKAKKPWEIEADPLPPCHRELRLANRVAQQAENLLAQNYETPGVQWRAEDAAQAAAYAQSAAAEGRCGLARVELRAALRYWRRARLKAGW